MVVSSQGTIEVFPAGNRIGQSLRLHDPVCPNDRIRVGASSRIVLSLTDNEILNLGQNTIVHLSEAPVPDQSLLDVIRGMVRFFSNEPRSFDVNTPFLNAGVRGTEFLVRVDDAGTFLLVLEGRVTARNPQGQVELTANQAVVGRAGAAPVVQLPVAPLDAVRWTLYYQPILSDLATDAGPVSPALPAPLREAIRLQRQGRIAEAVSLLERAAEADDDPRLGIYRAGLQLSVGQVDEARAIIDRVLAAAPDSGDALALRAVIAVARNDRVQALADARRAVVVSPRSAAAKIALSYALQASFELEAARDVLRQAVEQRPDDALAWARLAELWLTLGYNDRALQAAERAAALTPDLGWTQLVLGYAALARMDTTAARAAFERAIALESHNPLAHLGLGLAIIREGDLATGRRRMEIATGLDPANALVRSYLGKAYFEERRDEPAAEQLAFAKRLDPADPTPWFYDAIRKQTGNRPIEALEDLERAIELNNNRAVYRSRLLLDEDLAVRGVSLGRIYGDLGFNQQAQAVASTSLSIDPANASAHRFLSDAYLDRPRHEIARVSELLQAQLLQPLNTSPIQPRLPVTDLNIVAGVGPADVAYREYTPLFARDQTRLTATGVLGNLNTRGDEVILSGLHGRFSYSLGQFHYETRGFRENNDLEHDIYNLFAQAALTEKVNAQIELRRRKTDRGDIALVFDPNAFSRANRAEIEQDTARAGLHLTLSPRSDVIASVIYSDRTTWGRTVFLTLDRQRESESQGYNVEAQYLLRGDFFNITLGAGNYRVDQEQTVVDRAFGRIFATSFREDTIQQRDLYAYSNVVFPKSFIWTLGLSVDKLDNEFLNLEDTSINPKVGVQWHITDNVRLRAAAFRTVKRLLIVDQTIEPTNIAGFNQFFDDFNGTVATRYAAGLDVRLKQGLYAGMEASTRRLDVPFLASGGSLDYADQRETLYEAYLNWAFHPRWVLNAGVRFETVENSRLIPPRLETFSVPAEFRYFNPNGFFATVGSTFLHQDVDQPPSQTFTRTSENAIVVDASIGYRLPNRRGTVSLEIRNLFDENFLYQDLDFITSEPSTDPRFRPVRTFLARLTLNF